jgi:RNA polymerase sigma-70 factor (ECF subfamily)
MSERPGLSGDSTDEALLLRIRKGDLGALEQLFKRYQHSLYQTALGITHDPELSEEIVQDCFYKLYRHADTLDATLPLAPWLYRVGVNLCYSMLRRRRPWSEPFHNLAERLRVSGQQAPEQVAEQHEVQSIVRETLQELSPQHRAVLVLHYFHDYSVTEIAAILECPEGTIKSRLHHARRLLKQRLIQRLGSAPDSLPNQS